jgi:hypothetical protein
MKPLYIPIHSFVDVITNSSSEIYVTASRKTVTTVVAAIDAILKSGGSDKTCKDLFVVTLGTVDGSYGEYKVVEVHAKNSEGEEAAKLLNSLNTMFTAEEVGNGN